MMDSTQQLNRNKLPTRIVFYDGECGFCNTSVQFILNKRKYPIYFAPLQSDIAKDTMRSRGITIEMNTLYYLEDNRLFDRSTAALRIARYLKGGYPALYYLGILFPRVFRDWVYDQVAKRRHKIKPGYCAMPTPEERKLFLDC